MKIKIDTYTSFIYMLFSVFLFGYTVRVSTIPALQYISVLFIYGLFLLLRNYYCYINKNMFVFTVYLCTTIISDIVNRVDFKQWFLYFLMNTMPLIILTVDKSKIKLKQFQIRKLIEIYNFFIYLIFSIYIIDILSGSLIMRFLSENWLTCISNWIPKGESLFRTRYASYLGHYLYTDIIYLGFYILNVNYKRSFNDCVISPIVFNVISVIGVISTGSKTGLFVLAIMLIFFNIKKIKNIVMLIAGVIFLYYADFFNILFNRLTTEDFSTGRIDGWKTLADINVLKTHIFYGIGDNFFEYINKYVDYGTAGVITEFPIICIFYKIGVIGFVAFIWIMLLDVLVDLVNNRKWDGALSVFVFFFAISTYNGLLVYPDTQIVYSVVIMLVALMNRESVMKKEYYS